MRELQIGRIVERQAEPVGWIQGRRPAVGVRSRIGRNVEHRKIDECRVPQPDIDATPTNGDR